MPQLRYSQLQNLTHNVERRRKKASKVVAVLDHFIGTSDWRGLRAIDIGCSTGFTTEALASRGCHVLGIDIDAPGLIHAKHNVDGKAMLACADGSALPVPSSSIDVIVFNHIYEHVVDADSVMAEIRRVLRPEGVAYFGFGNRLSIIEPHYRLPLLSWLPRSLADRYVRLFGKADFYYEEFRTRKRLIEMCGSLQLWDYSASVVFAPTTFEADDVVPPLTRMLSPRLWRLVQPLLPTFIWVGTPHAREPAGVTLAVPPRLVAGAQ